MASKQDLQGEISLNRRTIAHLMKERDQAIAERDAAKRDADGAWNRIKAKDAAEHRRREDELRAQEREARRQHLKDLAAGRMDVKNASASAIVREDGQVPYVELTFPLDDDELPIVQRVLAGKPDERPEAFVYVTDNAWDRTLERKLATLHGGIVPRARARSFAGI